MAQLRQDYAEFARRGTAILVVGPDSAEAFVNYWADHDLPFIGLPDPEHTVLKRYGQEINLFKLGRMPAQIIVDREGVARYVHYGHAMSDIPSNEVLLDLLDELALEADAKGET
jgi:peroxiredoxin Q/BCP